MNEIEFIENFMGNLSSSDGEYKKNRFKIYKNYIEQSEVPVSLRYTILDNPFEKSTSKNKDLTKFIDNIDEYIESEFGSILNFADYTKTDIFATYLIQKYLRHFLSANDFKKDIIYINTPLLLLDNKRLIGYKGDESDFSKTLTHSKETICNGVENANLIIWDRFTDISTDYDKEEVYKTLLIRHKKGLSNLFFISGGVEAMVGSVTRQIIDMMGKEIINVREG